MNVFQAIRTFYTQQKGGEYSAVFDDCTEARKFAEGIREQLRDVGVSWEDSYAIVKQSNSVVRLYIDLVDEEDYIQSDDFPSITSEEYCSHNN